MNEYYRAHIERVVKATSDLYKQEDSPCRKCHDMDTICCLFCYCPRYSMIDCGGNYKILSNGVKDCSSCTIPHQPEFVKENIHRVYRDKT